MLFIMVSSTKPMKSNAFHKDFMEKLMKSNAFCEDLCETIKDMTNAFAKKLAKPMVVDVTL